MNSQDCWDMTGQVIYGYSYEIVLLSDTYVFLI